MGNSNKNMGNAIVYLLIFGVGFILLGLIYTYFSEVYTYLGISLLGVLGIAVGTVKIKKARKER